MSIKQTVAPTLDAVTLDEIKAQCGADGYDDYDSLLAGLRDRATEAVGKQSKRQIMSATFTLSLDCFPAEIVIDLIPVSAISSIAYTDSNGTAQTLTAVTDYQTDLSTYDGPARIKPAYGTSWPSTISDTYGAVVVTFVAGYTTTALVPKTIKHEICMMTAHWFAQREGVVVGTTASAIPAGLEMLAALNDSGAYQ